MPPPTNFPLRWESTGDQWWYASPIDWAAANGHFDLVRELLRLDGNHLINLTSLRRIRRLETVWDDEEQFHDVAKCRSEVARKLLAGCEIKKGKNSLLAAGYGGWLLYTAASSGDLGSVRELMEKDPLLVFGEGEYGVTDILYAAARSKDSEVFRVLFDFAASPRFSGGEENIGEMPFGYKLEIMNRGLHATARGGNLKLLKELLGDCSDDALGYRDIQGATVLHSAAARGQVEVVKYLTASSEIINSIENQGNTALHVASHRGHLSVVEALILASPSSINATNNAGETFLHAVITGFQTPGFRRIDRQIKLIKNLLSGKIFDVHEIINATNNEGRTALHLAIIGNIHSDLVELLMTVRSINVNIRDRDGMTPLDIIRQRPHSPSSELLTGQLISAGGMFGSQDYSARRVIASHLKRQSMGSSPGTSFRINDTEIFLHTGIENATYGSRSVGLSFYSPEISQQESNMSPRKNRKDGSLTSVNRLKHLFHWPKLKTGTNSERLKKLVDEMTSANAAEGVLIPLRQRFSRPSSLPNNKRTLSVRSNVPSPNAKKKLASGLAHGVMRAVPSGMGVHKSRSSSFSKILLSSQSSLDARKENDVPKPCKNGAGDDSGKSLGQRHGLVNKKRLLCFGDLRQVIEASTCSRRRPYDVYERSIVSEA